MNRRRAIALIGAAALAPAAFAQDRIKTVAYLSNGVDPAWLARMLATHGYVEGRNLRFVVRVAPEDDGGLEERAAELVRLPADVLVAFGARNINALARLTRTIPIVCGGTADPIRVGYAKTLRRPGGNITGLSYGIPEMAQINMGLMGAILPGLKRIVAIVGRARDGNEAAGWSPILGSFESVARAAGQGWEVVGVGTVAELDALVAGFDRRTTFVKFVDLPDAIPFDRAVAAVLGHRLASFSAIPQLARDGALLHYSIGHADAHRRLAAIVDLLLRGANPAETPFELPDRTTCIVNRATAKAIGITLPAEILARATEIVG